MDRLTNEEIVCLVKEMRDGSLSARDTLVMRNIPLIKKCVSEIKISTYDFEDLVQEAVAILLEKIGNYDSEKGALSTFIWKNVKYTLLYSTQEMPSRLYKLSKNINAAKKYLSETGKDTSAENVSALVGLTPDAYNKKCQHIHSYNYVSLDDCKNGGKRYETIGSYICDKNACDPEESYMNESMKKAVKKAVKTLPEKQQQILNLHYNLDDSEDGCCSLREIATMFNTNHQTIANLEKKALSTLKLWLDYAA